MDVGVGTSREVFTNCAGLRKLAAAHADNHFVLRTAFNKERPLPYLWLEPGHDYLLRLNEAGRILAAATIRTYRKGTFTDYKEGDVLGISQISVRADCRHQGLSKLLLGSIYKRAAEEGCVLSHSRFTDQGQACLTRISASLHRLYPDMLVLYPPLRVPVRAEKPYNIRFSDDKKLYLEFA